eukprot:m.165376 g.165376  ORF g.165376 m.165376 type:complete len:773 (+) comp31384_c0_seq1:206-2524(+)
MASTSVPLNNTNSTTIAKTVVRRLTANGISQLISNANPSLTSPTSSQPVCQVLSIRRFHIDPQFESALEGAVPCSSYAHETSAYDLVLSDGTSKTKCLLTPTFNHLIHQGILQPLRLVRVLRGRIRYDEADGSRMGVYLIDDLDVIRSPSETSVWKRRQNVDPAYLDSDDSQYEFAPSHGSRKTYVHLTRDDEVLIDDPAWHRDRHMVIKNDLLRMFGAWQEILEQDDCVQQEEDDDDFISPLAKLKYRREFAKMKQKALPKLLLKVVGKASLYCLAKKGAKKAVPYQASLMVTDGATSAVVVLWESAVQRDYFNVDVGDVIVISNYKMSLSKPNYYPLAFQDCSLEIAVNSVNPATLIEHVDPELLMDCANSKHVELAKAILDVPEREFCDRRALSQLSQRSCVSVCGMVVHLGRERREMGKDQRRWSYRWVRLQAPSTSVPLDIKIYSASQSPHFDDLCIGMVFVCTDAELVVHMRSSRRYTYCVSTRASRFQGWFHETTSNPSTRPFRETPLVQEVCEWVITADALALARGGQYEGCELWLSPTILSVAFPTPAKPIAMVEVIRVIKGLHLLETRALTVLATVSDMLYCDPASLDVVQRLNTDDGVGSSKKKQSPPRRSKRRKQNATADESKQSDTLMVGHAVHVTLPARNDLPVHENVATACLPLNAAGKPFEDNRVWSITLVGLNEEAAINVVLPSSSKGLVITDPMLRLHSVVPAQCRSSLHDIEAATTHVVECAELMRNKKFTAHIELFYSNLGVEISLRQLLLA